MEDATACKEYKKLFCNGHHTNCHICSEALCDEDTITCDKCHAASCYEHTKKCNWCGRYSCTNCHKAVKCEGCGFVYCEQCIDPNTNQCEACTNKQVVSIDTAKALVPLTEVFRNVKQAEIGLAGNYIIYYKKRLFGMLKPECIRMRRNIES